MRTYIALLRGINVGRYKKVLMADLRALFESLGFKDVKTYIQSGNVVFKTIEETNLARKIAEAIEAKYDFIVPVLVKNESEFHIEADCVYIYYSEGAGKTKRGNNFFEKTLKVKATARNYRTMAKLLAMAGS
jgi:uncharacterized protein (DUF1697 family)